MRKRYFKIFLINHYAGDIENKKQGWKVLQISCISVTNPVSRESAHTDCHIYIYLVHIIFVLLSACNRELFTCYY